ncbi:hypothetical protein F0L68_20545 [Solihabitans fulvus]|uniref:Lysozyme n=1 Tax=Solihabitans fulvus TaxID=1892852 RepID=A0A5B2X9F8_9PSEU|nr:lysozyme [Solihabitans fulvus]KAA2260117.1 hypothetical protein F0L68_20545 [Solihabitans fulvus]
MAHRNRPRPWSTRLGTATLVASAVIIGGLPVAAAAPPGSSPEDHYAGSEIAKHEGVARSAPTHLRDGGVAGMDVSSHQGDIDWQAAANNGARFAYVKATEGVTYTNPNFGQQYNGAYNVGMFHGAYHFALPDVSNGVDQANFFVDHGGGWSPDGRTLPPAMDIEYNPYGDTCYGMDRFQMANWLSAFSEQIRARIGRYPVIYTSLNWWARCTNNNPGFGANPLWVARYADSVGDLPASWGGYSIWQYANSGMFPGDQNAFNGSYDQLRAFATG